MVSIYFLGHFFPEEASFIHVENLLRSVTTGINEFFLMIWKFLGSYCVGACWFTRDRNMMQDCSFFEALEPSMLKQMFPFLHFHHVKSLKSDLVF